LQAQKRYDVLGQTSYAGIARIRFKATRNCGLFRSQPRMPLSAPVFMSKPIIHAHRWLSSLSNFIHTIPPRFHTLSSVFFHLYRVYCSCTQKTPRQQWSIGRKGVFSAGLRNPKAFPRGGRWPRRAGWGV